MALSRAACALLVAAAGAFAGDSPRFTAGMGLYRSGNCEAALAEFLASEKAGETEQERPLFQGICLAKQGDWSAAVGYLDVYTATRPGDARGWNWLAQSHLYGREFARAKKAIGRAIELEPNSADSYRTLGEIELERKDHDGAYRAWIKANQLAPRDARTTYYLGRLFFEAEFWNEAAGWLRQTLKSDPHHFAAMTYLGMCAERLEMERTAIDLYAAAIRESKQQKKPYAWAFLSYGKLLRQKGNEREALAVLEEAEQICPEAHLLTVLGQMLASTDPAKAVEVLRRAIAMDASIPDAHYRLSLLLRHEGKAAEAEAELEQFRQAKALEERNTTAVRAIQRER